MKRLTIFVALLTQWVAYGATPLESMLALPSAADGRTVSLSGRNSTTDGAGGMFSIITDDGRATNNGTVFRSTANTNLLFVRQDVAALDVRWFGADGSTDDTAAIQAAIDAAWVNGGGNVFFKGIFKITDALYVRPTVNLVGAGSGRNPSWADTNGYPEARIVNYGTNDAIIVSIHPDHVGDELYAPQFSRITDLWIQGNATSRHNIRIGDPVDGHAPGDYSYAYGYGTTVQNCMIVGAGQDGIHVSGAASVRLLNNEVIMSGRYGISTWVDANGCYFAGNHIQASVSYGAYLQSFWGSTFIGNTVEGNAPTGGLAQMHVKQSKGSIFTGNYFEGDDSFGVTIGVDNEGLSFLNNFAYVAVDAPSTDRFFDVSDDGTTGNNNIKIAGNTCVAGSGYVVYFRGEAFDGGGCNNWYLEQNSTPDTVQPYYGYESVDGLHLRNPGVYELNADSSNSMEWRVYSVADGGGAYLQSDATHMHIGTASLNELELFANGTNNSFVLGTNGVARLNNRNGNYTQFEVQNASTTKATFGYDLANSLGYLTSDSSIIYLRGGYVGINTNNPSVALEVLGAVKLTGALTADTVTVSNGINPGVLASDPGSPSNGDIWYNSSTHKYMGWADGALLEFNDPDFDVSNITQANIGTTQISGTNFVNTVVVTNYVTAPLIIADAIRQNVRSDLTHTETVTLDFATNTSQFLVLTGNVTLAASNLGTNRSYYLLIANAQATNCAVSYPAETLASGFNPASVAAGKHLHLWFSPHPTTNTIVFCSAAEQP